MDSDDELPSIEQLAQRPQPLFLPDTESVLGSPPKGGQAAESPVPIAKPRRKRPRYLGDSGSDDDDEPAVSVTSRAKDRRSNKGKEKNPEDTFANGKKVAGVSMADIDRLFANVDRMDDDGDDYGLALPAPIDTSRLFRDDSPAPAAGQAKGPNLGKDADAAWDDEDGDGDGKGKKGRKPKAKIDSERLLGPNGFPKLKDQVMKFKLKGKGREEEDIKRVMSMYQLWAHQMFPKATFGDAVLQIEKQCHNRRMQGAMREWANPDKGKKKRSEDKTDDEAAARKDADSDRSRSSSPARPPPERNGDSPTSPSPSSNTTSRARPEPSAGPSNVNKETSPSDDLGFNDDDIDGFAADEEAASGHGGMAFGDEGMEDVDLDELLGIPGRSSKDVATSASAGQRDPTKNAQVGSPPSTASKVIDLDPDEDEAALREQEKEKGGSMEVDTSATTTKGQTKVIDLNLTDGEDRGVGLAEKKQMNGDEVPAKQADTQTTSAKPRSGGGESMEVDFDFAFDDDDLDADALRELEILEAKASNGKTSSPIKAVEPEKETEKASEQAMDGVSEVGNGVEEHSDAESDLYS